MATKGGRVTCVVLEEGELGLLWTAMSTFHHHPRRQSKITVEYHRPSRESIQEYSALLADADSNKYSPSRAAPPPPSAFRPNTPQSDPPTRVRNSLQKPNPRSHTHTMAANHSPPPRPSRTNTANLNDIFPTQSQLAQRRLSQPAPSPALSENGNFFADPHENLPSASSDFTAGAIPAQPIVHAAGLRSRSGTTTKAKKSVLGSMFDVFKPSQRPEISTPYDPVHLTHVGFNASTGEFTGLPKEWQQLLQESGISRSEQEKNPQAVMEIVKFYHEERGHDPWDKLGNVGLDSTLTKLDEFANPVRFLLSFNRCL